MMTESIKKRFYSGADDKANPQSRFSGEGVAVRKGGRNCDRKVSKKERKLENKQRTMRRSDTGMIQHRLASGIIGANKELLKYEEEEEGGEEDEGVTFVI